MSNFFQINEYTNPKVLEEAKGIPIIVKELTPFIFEEFKKIYRVTQFEYLIDFTKEEIPLEGIYFEKINVHVVINESGGQALYRSNLSDWNEVDQIFKSVNIELELTRPELESFEKFLSHELLHSYEDYKGKLNNAGFLDRSENQINIYTSGLLDKKDKFGKNVKLHMLINYLYYLMSIEKRANVASVYFDIDKENITLSGFNENPDQVRYYAIYNNIKNNGPGLVDTLTTDEIKLLREYILQSSVAFIGNARNNDEKLKKELKKYFTEKSQYCLKKIERIVKYYLDENYVDRFEENVFRVGRMLDNDFGPDLRVITDRFKEINENIKNIN